jgi:phosphate transport system permease protein
MSSTQQVVPTTASVEQQIEAQRGLIGRLHVKNAIAFAILGLITAIVAAIFIYIILRLLVQGFPAFTQASFFGVGDGGIANELFNTFYILILSEIILIPISLSAAIYLVEYARQGRLITIIHFAAETLAGVPSLVLGMFGVLAFGTMLHLGTSRLTGALTLLCLNLPIALRLFEDALSSVPREQREGALALGATRWYTIRTVVIPAALPGLVTGFILTAGKIIGESAALLFTMGLFNGQNVFTLNPLIASDTLTTRLYYLKGPGGGTTTLSGAQETAVAAGIAAVLILLLLIINFAARGLGRVIERKITAA